MTVASLVPDRRAVEFRRAADMIERDGWNREMTVRWALAPYGYWAATMSQSEVVIALRSVADQFDGS